MKKKKFEAKIIAVDDENITLENLENKEKTTINFNDIKKLEPLWSGKKWKLSLIKMKKIILFQQ